MAKNLTLSLSRTFGGSGFQPQHITIHVIMSSGLIHVQISWWTNVGNHTDLNIMMCSVMFFWFCSIGVLYDTRVWLYATAAWFSVDKWKVETRRALVAALMQSLCGEKGWSVTGRSVRQIYVQLCTSSCIMKNICWVVSRSENPLWACQCRNAGRRRNGGGGSFN